MDPTASGQQLDPKLQDAYNRVMGLNTNAPADTSISPTLTPAASPTTSPVSPAPEIATTQPQPTTPTLPTVQPAPNVTQPDIAPVSAPTTPVVATPAEISVGPQTSTPNPIDTKAHGFVAKSGGGMKISPVILTLGGIAFLVAYTVVWIKIFNLSIPFINQ